MNTYLFYAATSVEQVQHPAEGKTKLIAEEKKPEPVKPALSASPDSFNIRGTVKQNQLRQSPAP